MVDRLVGVSVVGLGKVAAVPDLAHVRFTATAEALSAAEATDRITAAVTAMVAALVEAGVTEADRQTPGIQLSSWRDHPDRPLRHHAVQRLSVRLRDITMAGDVVRKVLGAGGEHAGLEAFTLLVDDRTPYLDEARRRAMADAAMKAEQLATLASRSLGPVIAIAETPDREFATGGFDAVALAAEATDHASAIPVEGGELDFEVRLVVEYAWGD